MVKIFSNKDYGERFIKLCIRRSDRSDFARYEYLFKSDSPTTVEWRWSAVIKVLKYFLERKVALEAAWDAGRFTKVEEGDNANKYGARFRKMQDGALNVTLITKTIRDPNWWAFGAMLECLHAAVEDLAAWAERCPCHGWIQELGECEADRLRALLRKLGIDLGDTQSFVCPLAGMRAPEFAEGALEQVIKN